MHSRLCIFFVLIGIFYMQLYGQRQKIRIVDIIDANLFRLETGQVIMLANVEAPSIHDEGEDKKVALEIVQLMETKKRISRFEIEIADSSQSKSEQLLVYLFEKFDLNEVDWNERFLEWGFGKFIVNSDGRYNEKYIIATAKAIENQQGIWEKAIKAKDLASVKFHRFSAGFGNKNYHGDRYQEYLYSIVTYKGNNVSQIDFAVMLNNQNGYGGCDSPEDWIARYSINYPTIYFSYKYENNFDYTGMMFGILVAHEGKRWCTEFTLPVIPVPYAGIKIGYPQKFYLTASIIDNFTLLSNSGIYLIGAGYHFHHRYSKIWLGIAGKPKNWGYAFTMEYLIFKRLQLQLQGSSHPHIDGYTLRLGLGYQIKKIKD